MTKPLLLIQRLSGGGLFWLGQTPTSWHLPYNNGNRGQGNGCHGNTLVTTLIIARSPVHPPRVDGTKDPRFVS